MWQLFVSVFLCTCCMFSYSRCATTTAGKSIVPTDTPWQLIVDGCKLEDMSKNYVCTRESLEKTYDNLVVLRFGLDECNTWRDGEKKVCQLELEKKDFSIWEKDNELSQWYRKWYIMLPLGLAVGVGAGIVIGVVLE